MIKKFSIQKIECIINLLLFAGPCSVGTFPPNICQNNYKQNNENTVV